MSSSATPTDITDTDMATIRSVLFLAGYEAERPSDGRTSFSTAALLLMRRVRGGETSAALLTEHLNACFDRPAKENALFASVLPRYAMQGLPNGLRQWKRPGTDHGRA